MEEQWIAGLRAFAYKPAEPSEVVEETVQWYQEYGVDNPNKNRFWITNGIETKMIRGEIPDGWVRGRGKVLSEEGKLRLSKLTAEKNRKGLLGWTAKKASTTH